MADTPEQMEIDVDTTDEKPKDAEVEVVKAEETPAKDEIDPNQAMEALKAQLEREKLARIEAEKRARQHAESAAQAKNEVQDSNLHLVNNAIETVKQNTDILKSQYAEAMALSDFHRAAEIQTAMSTNSAKLLQLEQGKQALESSPKVAAERVAPSDPVEALASQLSPRSANWVRRNPQCVTDPRMYQKMIAAHNLAMADGHKADTDDYFAAIEDTLKINRQDPVAHRDDAMADAAKVTQRRSAPPAAPVTRSGNGTGSSPNVVRLTAQEREMASMMGMTDKEYAKNKLALQKEGKLN